ncbi:MAG: acyltransferase family protein [Pseudomonadales bacterium]|nr:acyltransferase family protein [Pseudomonadales bacterium]
MGFQDFLRKRVVTSHIEECIDSIPKPVGSFGYDPWGYEVDGIKTAMGAFKPIYDKYFRVTAYGLENIPKTGPVLIICNHGGQIPFDGGLVAYALATNSHAPRAPRGMIERVFPTLPFIGNLVNKAGSVIGDPVNCAKMLDNDEAVIVFPEGARGAGKPFSKRYQLQRFGNGFMHLAITKNTPIIPVGIAGCEESMPSAGNFSYLAKKLGVPYVPIMFPVPLPTKVILRFGELMSFSGEIHNEKEVEGKVEQVKDVIRDLIDEGLAEKKGWFQ